MDFTTINSLNSYISGLKMQGLWHLRQQNGASHQDEITVDGVTFHRRDETLASIRAKLDAGGSLTEEERAYLRQHDPQAYQELLQEEQEQAAYERALRSCKTKEEADRLQMNRIGQSLSRIQTVEHDPAIPLHAKLKVAMREKRLVDAAADSMREFVASGDYDRLPSEWEEAKKKPDTPVQPPEELPEESRDPQPEEIPEQSRKPEQPKQPEQGTEAAAGSPVQGKAEREQVHSAYRSQSTAAQPAGIPAFRHEQAGIKHKKQTAGPSWDGPAAALPAKPGKKYGFLSIPVLQSKPVCVILIISTKGFNKKEAFP